MSLKIPEYERTVLATLLMSWEFVPVAMPKLTEDHFTDIRKEIFQAIEATHQSGKEVDLVTVEVWLKENKNWIDRDIENLSSLVTKQTAPAKAEEYIEELSDRKTSRTILPQVKSLAIDIEKGDKNSSESLAELERIKEQNLESASIPGLTASEIRQRDADKPRYERLYTGNQFFDTKFYKNYGSHRGTTKVIFGETKHGKSYVAQWESAAYLDQGYNGIYITMEDIDRNIMDRVERQMETDNIENMIFVDQGQGCSSLHDIINIIKYWNAVRGLDFAVVDYLQRIPVQGIDYNNETSRIVSCTNLLTNLATSEDILFTLLAQVNREATKYRSGWEKEPNAFDIYGSSAIEKDAFMAFNVFRPNRVDELCETDYQTGELTGVQGPDGSIVHRNSVYIRQRIVREGEMYRPYVRFIHNNNGLHHQRKHSKQKEYQVETPF
ncbi:DnaB-like helicase N-terminal domain-containing protein [Halalkalibaculum sp. DA3122]|uniref:DnaB-like helicase N-terminal domain-containing protein n=1 Tax=Halalkalibaculum sp. DA3122 TaxID=3373607 RepID=UPI003754B52D